MLAKTVQPFKICGFWKAENVGDGSWVFGDNEFHAVGAAMEKLRGPYVLLFVDRRAVNQLSTNSKSLN